jgi:hypothetical protein
LFWSAIACFHCKAEIEKEDIELKIWQFLKT